MVSFIGAANLAKLRQVQASARPQTATVTIPGSSTSQNDLGEPVPGEPTVFTMPCRLTSNSNTADEGAGSAAYSDSEQRWEMSYPISFTIPSTATIMVDGAHFEVVAPVQHQAYPTERRAILRLIGG